MYLELGEAIVQDNPIPLTWTELWSWSNLTDTELTPTEARALIDLSREYVKQFHASRDPLCPPPIASDQGLVVKKVEAFFAALRRMKK